MVAWYDCYIKQVPGIPGGEPVITGTRTPVRTIVQMFKTAYPGNLFEITQALPHLTGEQIKAALDYYRDHPGNRGQAGGQLESEWGVEYSLGSPGCKSRS